MLSPLSPTPRRRSPSGERLAAGGCNVPRSNKRVHPVRGVTLKDVLQWADDSMKRQEDTLRRLLLGDDGSAQRARAQQQQLQKQQKTEEDDDVAMMYLAKEVSKKQLEEEQRKINEIILKKEEKRKGNTAPTAPVSSGGAKADSYEAQLEEAIAQSLIEARNPSRGRPTAPPAQAQARPAPTRQTTSSTATGLDDPAVVAFMEKRRLREQQQREEALQRSMAEEAQRLSAQLAAESGADGHNAQNLYPTDPRAVDPSMCQQDRRLEYTQSHAKSQSMPQRYASPASRHMSSGANIARSQSHSSSVSPYAQAPVVPMPAPVAEYDHTHVLHPDNAVAYKAAAALLQLARRSTRGMVETEFNTRENATLQLASVWLTQASQQVISAKAQAAMYNTAPTPPPPFEQSPHMYASPPLITTSPMEYATPSSDTIPRSSSRARPMAGYSAQHQEPPVLQRADSRARPVRNPSFSAPPATPELTLPPVAREVPWDCPTCTLFNQATFLTCEACGVPRP